MNQPEDDMHWRSHSVPMSEREALNLLEAARSSFRSGRFGKARNRLARAHAEMKAVVDEKREV